MNWAPNVCSNNHLLKEEIKYLEYSFTVINSYRKWFFEQTLESFQSLGVISKVANASRQKSLHFENTI